MALKPNKFAGGVEIENENSLDLKENSSNGSNKISLKAPASLASDTTYTLPADGPANAVLKTDASGNLSWTTGVGSGGINYIDNYDAATDTTGYNTYDDGASADPVDGTGGSAANLTFTRNTSTPLRGTADFDLAKGAADAQGEGVSYDFDIDAADQGKVLRISFDYTVSADYDDDDIRIQIYDKTNSAIIQTVGRDLKATSLKSKHIAEFQTAADSTAYRLCIHVSSTNASAYQLNFDNVEVGPREIARGSVITDWKEYTPTFSGFGSVTNIEFEYRRVGDTMDIRGRFTTGTVAASEAQVSLPAGHTISIPSSTAPVLVGTAHYNGNSSLNHTVIATNGDTFLNFGRQGASAALAMIAQNGNDVFASSTATGFFASGIKIAGWSANSEISSDFGSRIIFAEGEGNDGASITANTTNINFTETIDTAGAFDGTTFTAPETGYYQIDGNVFFNASGGRAIELYVNGTRVKRASEAITDAAHHFSAQLQLQKGDALTVRSNGAGTLSNTTYLHYVAIHKVQSPQTLAGGEIVAASYTTNAGQAVVTNTDLVFEDLENDTFNAYNTSTGEYTIPKSGVYNVSTSILFASATYGAGQAVYVDIHKNSSFLKRLSSDVAPSGTFFMGTNGSIALSFVKGDVIKLVATNERGSTNLTTIVGYNTFSISKVN